jgi:hypothetical protein
VVGIGVGVGGAGTATPTTIGPTATPTTIGPITVRASAFGSASKGSAPQRGLLFWNVSGFTQVVPAEAYRGGEALSWKQDAPPRHGENLGSIEWRHRECGYDLGQR